MPKSPIVSFAGMAASFLILLGAYWSGLHGGFFFDDGPSILFAKGVHLKELSLAAFQEVLASGTSGPTQRPVAQLSFALNHYVSGLSPFAYKATNLAIHAANGLLIYLLALRLTSPFGRKNSTLTPEIGALGLSSAWLLHPIQLLPVLHVVQRMTSLSAFFLLSAVLLHIDARERSGSSNKVQLLVTWLCFWPLSILTKETGLLFPLFVLAWELTIRKATHGTDCFTRAFTTTISTILLGASIYLLLPASNWLWAGYGFRDFSMVERLFSEGRVLWLYLSLIVCPRLGAFGLQHDDIAISTSLYSPWTTTPAVLSILALLWISWVSRKRFPLAAFGIFWFFIGHLMESTILPLELAHEHRNYLPLFGVLLSFFSLMERLVERKGIGQTLGIALSVSFIAYASFVTTLRAHAFGDNIRMTQMEAENHKNSPRAHYEAGLALAYHPAAADSSTPVYAFARKHYEESEKLSGKSKHSLVGLIHLNCQAGIPVEQHWISALKERFEQSPIAPGDRSLMFSLKAMAISGAFCLSREDMEAIFTAAQNSAAAHPHIQAKFLSWHADYLWLGQRDLDSAKLALGKALNLMPGDQGDRLKWAQLIYLSRDIKQAQQLLLELQESRLSIDERETLRELLETTNVAGH